MYSRSSWGGPVDPFIKIIFPAVEGQSTPDPIVSVVVFEWKDWDLIGVPDPEDLDMVGSLEEFLG
jgi:hypothetical protein